MNELFSPAGLASQVLCKSEEKTIWILLSLHESFNKERCINYVPKFGTDVTYGSKLFAAIA